VLRLAAEHLLPGECNNVELAPIEVLRKGGRGRVAERQSSRSRDPISVGNANAEVVPFHAKMTSLLKSTFERSAASHRAPPRRVRRES